MGLLAINIICQMKIIIDNPYRQLGVYSTSTQKEVVSNLGKMKAFLKVGRSVAFPLDLDGFLQPISRTERTVADANSMLSLPAERLKYAQFWFAKITQIDEIACGKLTSGDVVGAMGIWEKKVTASSLQNLLLCYLIKKQLGNALEYAQTLYTSYCDEFVKMVFGDNALMTSVNLWHTFLDALCEEFTPHQFLGYISNQEWKDYVADKVTKPLLDKITSAIDTCKTSKGSGIMARYKAGTKLMNDTKDLLSQLRQFFNENDFKYQLVADKLGLEILQCGIDYYNDSSAQDAAQKAMTLQKYALSVVVGKMAKDRCKENVDILAKIIADLPPSQVFDEDRAIKEELRKFCKLPDKIVYSVNLLNATKPHLQVIKDKLGFTNSYYVKISTQVVGNALHNVIEEVNLLQNEPYFKVSMSVNREVALSMLKGVLRDAWNAIKIMDTFDMESGFKRNRYDSNRKTLCDMCNQLGISTYSVSYSSTSKSSSSSSSSAKSSSSYNSNNSSRTSPSSSSSSDDNGCLIGLLFVIVGGSLGAAIGGGGGAFIGCIIGIGIYGKIME